MVALLPKIFVIKTSQYLSRDPLKIIRIGGTIPLAVQLINVCQPFHGIALHSQLQIHTLKVNHTDQNK
jgi:hypothetical protein